MKRWLGVTLILLVAGSSHVFVSSHGTHAVRFLMGTWCDLLLVEPETNAAAVEAVFQEISRLDEILSSWRDDSELARLNRRAGHGPQPVSADMAAVVSEARDVCGTSHGAFDPSVAPLIKTWGFLTDVPGKPTDEQARQARLLVGCDRVAVGFDPPTITLAEGTSLDLGGIGKGYAVDRALEVLQKSGVTRAKVDFGSSSLGFLGRVEGGWPVVLADPRNRERPLVTFRVDEGAVSSSGQYERSFAEKGRRYGHIFDPHTGAPVESRMLMTTAIAPRGSTADALSTALFVMGAKNGSVLVASLPGVSALFVEERGGRIIVTTAGRIDRLTRISP